MPVQTWYDLVAPVSARVLDPILELATVRAVERVGGGWPSSVLDVGVGSGRALAQLGAPGRRVVGIDPSPTMLALAAERLRRQWVTAALLRSDALRLPFAAGTFDAVLSLFVLDLLPEPEVPEAVAEFERVLTPGGRLVVGVLEVPNRVMERAWRAVYRALPAVVGRRRPIALDAYLARKGLRVLREERVGEWLATRLVTLVKAGS